MKNEIKNLFTNEGEELGISAEEIVLAPDEEIYAEAAQIAAASAEDVKYPFIIKYDVNWKEFLLDMIDKCGGVVKEEINDTELAVSVNMTQLKFIKALDCVEKVSEYEDEFLALMRKEKNVIIQNAQTMTLTADEPVAMSVEPVETNATTEASVACESPSSSCCCPSNNTMETAREIQLEQFVSGQICCPGTEQWFKFTTAGSGIYTIYTTGSLDTEGTLYDCDGLKLEEADNYNGRINFRIVADLPTEELHYIKVTGAKQNTGNYQLKVTENTLVDSVSINKGTIVLEKDKKYELPIRPNYTYLNVEGTERIDGLSVSLTPSNADEQRVYWSSIGQDVVEVSFDWYKNEKENTQTRYQTITAKNIGVTDLYVYDWDEHGKRGQCTVYVTEGWPKYEQPTIYSRASWGARNVVDNRLAKRTKKPEMIIFHHTADKFESTDTSKIIAEIKETQDEHIDDEGKCDIAYHFIIDPAGGIWQGAEIDEYQRGHANGHFDDIGVVLLGDFESRWQNVWMPNTLNDNQKAAMQSLSKWLCYKYDLPFDRVNRISPITTHKTASGGTECPGDNAEPWIENDLENYITNWHP